MRERGEAASVIHLHGAGRVEEEWYRTLEVLVENRGKLVSAYNQITWSSNNKP